MSFPQGYLDCKEMLSNAADKITGLVLTKEMKKYFLYDYKRNLKFGKLLLCPLRLFPY